MNGPIDGILAIHNAFRRDITAIDTAALDAARGKPGLEATIERFRFFNEVLEWHAIGEDKLMRPLLETVAPDVYESYERDHRTLDVAFEELSNAVSLRDPIETARATKAFKFHLDNHLAKEDAHMYRLIRERVALPDQERAVAMMGADSPAERFPEVVAWMFPLMGVEDRVSMTRVWQMSMPPDFFAKTVALIQHAIGDEWTDLARNLPDLAAAH
jgi:hypothetical protein